MKRVAHVTLGLDTGGQEKLLVEFARHAGRERFDLTFISLTTRGVLAETLQALGCRVLALNERPGVRPGMTLRLARLFRAETFDVVHTHDDRPLLYAVPAAWLADVGRRIHTHHHGKINATRWRQSLLIRAAARLTSAFVCVSHDSARYLAEIGVPRSRLQTIWNGIDLSRFAYQGPNPTGSAVTVARLSPEKDLQNLLRAARVVLDQNPAFRLDIAGDGPCREELQGLRHELRLTECVRFLGEVRDVPALLARASLFVLPSQSEGISLTLLEAMARGLPVVTTDVGGNPEVVADGRTGLLVPAREPAALAHAILRLTANYDEALAMGREGRARVERHFDVQAMVARYEALYEMGTAVPNQPRECLV